MNEYTFKNKNVDKKFFYTQDNHLKNAKEQILVLNQDKSSPSPQIKNMSKMHSIPEENNDQKENAMNTIHKDNNINSNINTNNDNKNNLNLFQSKPKIRIKKRQLNSSRSDFIVGKTTSNNQKKINNELNQIFKPQIRNQFYSQLKTIDYTFNKRNMEIKKELEKIRNKRILSKEEQERESLKEIRTLKKPIVLTSFEKQKLLDIYSCNEVKKSTNELKNSYLNRNYSCDDFGQTKFLDKNSFNVFYNKMHKDNEIYRKGGENLRTPSFNLIRATKEFRVVPKPIGVVKKKGEESKLDLNNKKLGDDFIQCVNKSLEISTHLTSLDLGKNRLSDMSLIPLIQTIIKNNNLLKRLVEINLSYNKIGIAATELLCKYMTEYDCNLEILNLESNALGNNNGRKIIEAISKNLNNKIKYLNLAKNILDDDVSKELSILIKKCDILNVLILYQNQFSNIGAGLLMSELKKHPQIKILDLSWNLIGTNLTDEIPTLDELIKANKNPKNHFDNAYLNEIKYTLQFRKQNSTSPARIGSKVSYFTNQLCELFQNKETELLHLDISYNNINALDGKAISESIKDNHSILGIHVDGNDMYVDEFGFVYPMEKSNYKRNHFANSQLFYRLADDHPLISSNVLNVKKLRSKNNCWICEGWREIKFNYKPSKSDNNYETDFIKLYLSFENYKSINLNELNLIDENFVCYRMCPPGASNFFLTKDGIPIDSYGPVNYELKDVIIYTQELKPSEFEDEEENEEKDFKKFIITKVGHINVEINPDVINSKSYVNNLKNCIPRPEYNKKRKKRPRTPWSFPVSIWAWYGYDYYGEQDSSYNNAFEFDYERCNFGKDKDLSEDDEYELKSILKERYKKLVETYKNLSAYLGWKIWQIGQNQITEFAQSCTDLIDSKYLINDVLVKVTEVKSNIVDKQERKKNINIPDNIIRHQFMMLLVKIAKDKYFRTKQIGSIPESVQYAFDHNYNSYINQFDNHKWRKERYYNEEVDNILKAHIPIFDALFYSYSPQQIMGRKDSFWMTLDNFTIICTNLMDSDFPVKDVPVIFSISMKLITNEINSDKHYNMIFPEFLEAICRFIDKLSPIPNDEESYKWDMKRRQEQPLYIKIETMIPRLVKLISGQYKNVRDKFVLPSRDPETGLFIINYNNPFYDGKLPPLVKKKKKDII